MTHRIGGPLLRALIAAALVLVPVAAFAEGGERAPMASTASSTSAHPLDLVSLARQHDGKRASQLGLPRTLWCADFVNLVRREAGLRPVPSRLARDQALGGTRLAAPRVGTIVVLSRGKSRVAAHTGIVSGITASGDLVVISGNHNRQVAEAVYARSRAIAFVDPS